MSIAPDTTIQYIPRGSTTTRSLRVSSGATDLTIATGTFTLYEPDGTSHYTGTFTNNAISLTLAADVDLGAGWREAWTFTESAATYTVRRSVIVSDTLDSRMLLIGTADVIAVHPATLSQYPVGQTSWERPCTAATRMVLRQLADLTAQGQAGNDLLNADALYFPVLYTAIGLIMRDGYALSGPPSFAALADDADQRVADWWRRVTLRFDADGDGAADRVDRIRPQDTGSPPPSPVGV